MLIVERGRARLTIDAYGRDLGDFIKFLAGRGDTASTADSDAIRAYMAELAGRMKPGTSARRLSALRNFYQLLFA